MQKLSPDPRLPIPNSDPYQKQLNVRLYEVLRDVIQQLNRMVDGQTLNVTTTEKNALTPQAGMVVFDTTLGKLSVYTGSAWETVSSS
jgi:hypothetical protein